MKRILPVALIAVPALMLAAVPLQAVPRGADSALHGYILGRFAYDDDRLGDAARYIDDARLRDPSDTGLALRAFNFAVDAGDERLAVELAGRLSRGDASDANVALVRLAAALKRRDWATVDELRPALATAGYFVVLGPLVEAWTLYARGHVDAALALLDPAKYTGFTRSYVAEHRAHLLAAAGRFNEAAGAYHGFLAGVPGASGIQYLRIGEADALDRAGRTAEAKALLDRHDGAQIDAARRRLDEGKRIGAVAPDPKAAIALVCARLAIDLSADKPVPLALTLVRVASFLGPDSATTWLLAGDVLARSDRRDAALAAYARIPASDPLAPTARARRAEVLSAAGREAEARVLLEAAANAPGANAEAWSRLGDWYRKAERHADAARAYGRAIALAPPDAAVGAGAGKTGWGLYFLRGSSLEQSGDWAAAEPDLRRALALAPDEPAVLNYLGYALLDHGDSGRGQSVPAARALIARAAKLRPDDGFISDSLGWADYRLGDYAGAAAALERAVAAEPGDPTINEHLGDAYWRLGRRIEARFRWRAALDLGTDAKAKAGVAAKLDYGLDAALASKGDGGWPNATPNTRPPS